MSRELFVYWRCAADDVRPAVAAVQAMQAGWSAEHSGLQARLLYRQGGADGAAKCTLMECYAHPPHGIGDTLAASIETDGTRRLGGWVRGTRHVEVFEPIAR